MEGEEELRPKYALPIRINKLPNGQVELLLPDQTKLAWPAENLPEDIGSDQVFLEIVTSEVLEHRKKELAREVLLKILNIGRESV